ncbi:MAG: ligase-associated DNA damage response exonuclease [Pseudomonadota bacterium]
MIARAYTPGNFETWLYPTDQGLYCAPGDFFIDPHRPVARAVVTHGHADHARPGNEAVLATPETLAVMQVRYGAAAGGTLEALVYDQPVRIGDVDVRLVPAGHVLGSAQVVLDYGGVCAVVSGDYKRKPDPTAADYELVRCDLFITEATFGLPVFRHEPDAREIAKLLTSVENNPERAHLVGAYGLGKCQRVMALLRAGGYDKTIWLHGANVKLCELFDQLGIDLGHFATVSHKERKELAGEIVLAPPSALQDRWSRRMPDPLTCFASGWMRVKGRARQRGVELPLVISDHADWPDLIRTIAETGAEEIWVTHGREDALVHQIEKMGKRGRALALVGFEDEDE